MLVLAIDTSTKIGSVSLYDDKIGGLHSHPRDLASGCGAESHVMMRPIGAGSEIQEMRRTRARPKSMPVRWIDTRRRRRAGVAKSVVALLVHIQSYAV